MVMLIWDGPTAVTESHHGIAMGYYVDCDSAVCRDCAPAGFAGGDYSQWEGFEGWESPIAIFMDGESDSPTHCCKCSAVIAHDLTIDGAVYVRDAIAEFISGNGHAPDVMAQWWDAYGDTFNSDDLALIAGTVAAPTADADESDMREMIERAMVTAGCQEFKPER